MEDGRDFGLHAGNAQGDMAALDTMVDEAMAHGIRLLITMSAPSLQAALRRARDRPVVFTYVADPFAAGAGKMAARVIRGESPGAIPFEPVHRTCLLVNLAARVCGLTLPPSLLSRADQLFDTAPSPAGH